MIPLHPSSEMFFPLGFYVIVSVLSFPCSSKPGARWLFLRFLPARRLVVEQKDE